MPTPRLRSTNGQFFCSLCKTELKAGYRFLFTKPPIVQMDHGPSLQWPKEEEMSAKERKLAVFNEWDEHLRTVHPRQWERAQRKRTRRRAAAQPYTFPKESGMEGQ
jgi:hypothetical protein